MNRVIAEGLSIDIPAASCKPPRKTKVFLLEDEPVALQLYADLLAATSEQFQIHKFADGDDAWAELTKVDPDILIMDIVHPGLDGWEMLKLLAAEKVTYPVLVVTGDSQAAEFYKSCYPDLKLAVVGKPFRVQSFYQQLFAMLHESSGFNPTGDQSSITTNNGDPALQPQDVWER